MAIIESAHFKLYIYLVVAECLQTILFDILLLLMFVYNMDLDCEDMLKYVIGQSELEGHIDFYSERKHIWKQFKEVGLLAKIVNNLKNGFISFCYRCTQKN